MYLYRIDVLGTDQFYIGITRNPEKRKRDHIQRAGWGYKTRLYDVLRKYPSFELTVLAEFGTREEACAAEVAMIKSYREANAPIMNHADGGDGGFVVQDTKEWREKLSAARKGRTPAKGMKHTQENKDMFKAVSLEYWSTQVTYEKDADAILALSHKEAKKQFGISTTHYYRLKKRFKGSDLR